MCEDVSLSKASEPCGTNESGQSKTEQEKTARFGGGDGYGVGLWGSGATASCR